MKKWGRVNNGGASKPTLPDPAVDEIKNERLFDKVKKRIREIWPVVSRELKENYMNLIKVLDSLGFIHVNTKGDHLQFRNPRTGENVTVPMHARIKDGTFSNIMRQMGVDPVILSVIAIKLGIVKVKGI
ncbi:MAG: type II toxin-antitoxin system HicA family toxin [Candidatus Anstonellales archaeon]